MKLLSLSRKVVRGLPYLAKEVRAQVSNRTPLFIAKPRVVHLWRFAPCNGRCIMCDYGFLTGEARKALFKVTIPDDKIPPLLEQIHELGGRGTMVSYMGGEPLLTRPLLDWLDQAKALGLDFRFTTNGYLIDEEVARRLVAANLFNIGVSIESLDPKINEQIRPIPDGTAKTTRAIDLLIAERRRQRARLSVNIKCTLTQLSFESAVGILERWGKEDGVIVTPQVFGAVDGMPQDTRDRLWVSDLGRLETTLRKLKEMRDAGYHLNADDQALDNFVKAYREDPQRAGTLHRPTVVDDQAPPCTVGTDNLFIIHGEVQLCPSFPAIGNVLTGSATLKELWYSPQARQSREKINCCRALCNLSCLRRTSLWHKVRTFLNM